MARRPAFWALVLLGTVPIGVSGAASDLVDFARCITRARATFYTATWCAHCGRQVRMFGNAIRYVNVVDCTRGCDRVHSFPTWTFADGSRISGVASFDELADRTRCRLGGPRDDAADDATTTIPSSTGSPGARERNVGGAKIIEIPRR